MENYNCLYLKKCYTIFMTKQQMKLQKKKLIKFKTIISRFGKDTKVSSTKETASWLKKSGYPSLANLISNGC